MDIENKKVLILGAWGLVGNAITHKIIKDNPSQLILTSLREEDIKNYKKNLLMEFPHLQEDQVKIWWGDIFVRNDFKDQPRSEVVQNEKSRRVLIKDFMEELDEEILINSSLFQLINTYKPDLVIDCINTATGIAYQDIYSTYNRVKKTIIQTPTVENLTREIENIMASLYVPQLIRHIQILYTSMNRVGTKTYMKIGTSGTGGYGLNIPYTHSEEKPSRVLLSKSAIGGAHSMLLFLMGRTPESAITKEVKPTAAIAWKRIGFGPISKGGKPVMLYDIPLENALPANGMFMKNWNGAEFREEGNLEAVFIDTGENGVFSKGEFEAVTAQGQMEFVTPEEIADVAIFEIKGGNTGHDIVNALDNATLEPTYRAGFLQHSAVEKLEEFENKFGKESIAFEQVGPPRLSKLLIEAYLLKKLCGNMDSISDQNPTELSERAFELLKENAKLRNEIVSIGIPILFPDGKTYLRGPLVKIPKMQDEESIEITDKNLEIWIHDGWVDLRPLNFSIWTQRITELMNEARLSEFDTSSMHVRTPQYWNNFKKIDIGKVVSWIFINEEHGRRMKA